MNYRRIRTLLVTLLVVTATLAAAALVNASTLPAVTSGQTEVLTGGLLGTGYDPHKLYLRQTGAAWRPTYAGGATEGRLLNFRAANALFDDEKRTDDNPDANTDAFIANFDAYKSHGVLGVTVSLQGGNPGYEGAYVSAFQPDGSLKPAWTSRASRVIQAANAREMVVILTYFYGRQDQILADAAAVKRAVVNATDWLISQNYRNVIIEIANEANLPAYFDHSIIYNNTVQGGIGELINLAKSRFDGKGWRLPVSASRSDCVFKDGVAQTANLALVHGNGVRDWEGSNDTYGCVKAIVDNFALPVVMNEDDNSLDVPSAVSLGREAHALDDALRAGGSWGLMWRPYNQFFPMRWSLGDPTRSTSQDGYFHAVLDLIQNRVGVTAAPTPTVPTATLTPSPSPTTPLPTVTPTPIVPTPGGSYRLNVSFSSNRSNPVPLAGLSVSGDIYVSTNSATGVSRVSYYLDDPNRTRVPRQVEGSAPFDFAGGDVSTANPFNTKTVSNGSHTITAALELTAGGTTVVHATFTVNNTSQALAFSPNSLSFALLTDGSASGTTALNTTNGSAASFTVSDSATWLTVSPGSGTTPASLTIAVDARGLAPGTYNATITATASGYTSASSQVTLTVTNPTDRVYLPLVSMSADRSNAVALNGLTVSGNIYVFTSPDIDVRRVRFYLDDPNMTGSPAMVESNAPFDFAGGNTKTAKPLRTASLANGSHSITAALELVSGEVRVTRANFVVST